MAKKRRRRRLKKSIKFILGIILLLLIFLFIFLIYSNTSKYLFFQGINTSSEEIVSLYNDFKERYMPYYDDYYYNSTNTYINIETEELDESINFIGDIYLTKESNYFDLDIDANSAKYDLELYTKDSRLYYKIDDSKYYYTDSEVNLDNYYAYDDLFKVFVKAIKNNVSNSDFTKTKEKIGVNSKEYNTKKVSLTIDNALYNRIMKEFYENVKKSDVLISTLYSFTSYESIDALVNYMDSFNEKESNEEIDSFEYSIYYYKSRPIKHYLVGEDYELSYISIDSYKEINYTNAESTSYMTYENDEINIYLGNLGYVLCKLTDDSITATIVDMDKKSLGSLEYKISGEYSNELALVLDLELIHLEIDSKNKIEVNKELPKVNVSDSISSENISEIDSQTLDELLYLLNGIIAF